MKGFYGFTREDGSAGIRNYIAVIPTVFCANEVVAEICKGNAIARPLIHNEGCGQVGFDIRIVTKILIGMGLNPNSGAVLLVSLGCEGVSIEEVHQAIKKEKKWVEKISIHKSGGMKRTIKEGHRIIKEMSHYLSRQKRVLQPFEKMRLAIKCGSSDTSSGIAANPATGKAVDDLIDLGVTVVFGETTELIGAEKILMERCFDDAVRKKLIKIIEDMERGITKTVFEIRGTQPSPGNIAGGLSTIEEKSLGAISKSGSKTIMDILEYGDRVTGSGLYIMDSPGKEDEYLTGVCSCGANIVVFTSGGGAPQGFPLIPVIKVASNPKKVQAMREHVDIDVSGILTGNERLANASQRIKKKIFKVCSGEEVAAERNRYDRTVGIYTKYPTI